MKKIFASGLAALLCISVMAVVGCSAPTTVEQEPVAAPNKVTPKITITTETPSDSVNKVAPVLTSAEQAPDHGSCSTDKDCIVVPEPAQNCVPCLNEGSQRAVNKVSAKHIMKSLKDVCMPKIQELQQNQGKGAQRSQDPSCQFNGAKCVEGQCQLAHVSQQDQSGPQDGQDQEGAPPAKPKWGQQNGGFGGEQGGGGFGGGDQGGGYGGGYGGYSGGNAPNASIPVSPNWDSASNWGGASNWRDANNWGGASNWRGANNWGGLNNWGGQNNWGGSPSNWRGGLGNWGGSNSWSGAHNHPGLSSRFGSGFGASDLQSSFPPGYGRTSSYPAMGDFRANQYGRSPLGNQWGPNSYTGSSFSNYPGDGRNFGSFSGFGASNGFNKFPGANGSYSSYPGLSNYQGANSNYSSYPGLSNYEGINKYPQSYPGFPQAR